MYQLLCHGQKQKSPCEFLILHNISLPNAAEWEGPISLKLL